MANNLENKYYDGTKLLSLTDINGCKPEIYITTSNRSGGKTTYFGRLLVNRWYKKNHKFALLYRYKYELDECADKFFKDISSLFFNEAKMTAVKRAKGVFFELFIDDVSCGYALSLNSADQIKKYSHLFSDIQSVLFDEFQSETNMYLPNEVKKFISIHQSIARGHGKQSRYVPVYMLSNPVSLLNPYYVELGICNRINNETKFLRGNGWVLEQGFNENASKAQKESAFNKAFENNAYNKYASEGIYLNDNYSFIEKPQGVSRYLATIKFNGIEYALREYSEIGVIYCDKNVDSTYPFKISATTDDHQVNYVMLKRNDIFIANMRYYFERGCFRFKDLSCKDVILKILSY